MKNKQCFCGEEAIVDAMSPQGEVIGGRCLACFTDYPLVEQPQKAEPLPLEEIKKLYNKQTGSPAGHQCRNPRCGEFAVYPVIRADGTYEGGLCENCGARY